MKKILRIIGICIILFTLCLGSAQAADIEKAVVQNIKEDKEDSAGDMQNQLEQITPNRTSMLENSQDDSQQSAAGVLVPICNSFSIHDVDIEKGSFQIVATNIENAENIKSVQFAVWSESKGQDDLIWYSADYDEKGTYTKWVNIAAHKYSVGKYFIHMYAIDNSGQYHYLSKVEQNLNVQRGTLTVEKEDEGNAYIIKLSDCIIPGGVDCVQFPTWSEINGQDDIQWYQANKGFDGNYKLKVLLSDHKGLGEYHVHAYAMTKGGEKICVGTNSFETEEPIIGNVSIEDYDKEKGTFKVVASDVHNDSLIRYIQIPVWSQDGEQDDICWYRAEKDFDGRYVVQVNIKNHKYTMGTYFAHVYATDITGMLKFCGSTEQLIEKEKGELTISQSSVNKEQYTVRLKDMCVPGGISSVMFPTWSDVNGQDDIQWYNGKKMPDGTYEYTISLNSHKGLGKFYIHAYAQLLNGSRLYLNSGAFETKVPKIENIDINDEERDAGRFSVKISKIENPELIRSIQVPVWSEDTQGDIIWYTATKNLEGDYVVNINIRDHKYNVDQYNVHVYLTDITGDMHFVGATTCDMNTRYSEFTAEDKDGTESTYSISINGLKVPGGEKDIRFAVWGEDSWQNDIQWYGAYKQEDGLYSYDVPIRNHKELGVYNVHAYCLTKGNKLKFIGATSFEVKTKPQIAGVTVSDIDGTKGTFTVTVAGVMGLSGIEKVDVPIWCSDNQSDIIWYGALKVGEGTYTVNAKVKNHSHHFGEYKVHTYVTMKNGVRAFTGSTTATIAPVNYVYNKYISDTKREVGIMGVDADRVQFPTWSDANGQDDVRWYEGTNRGSGTFNVIVDSANHNSGGAYTTHIYVIKNGKQMGIGGTTYSLSKIPTQQGFMQMKANLYSSSTPYLILVNRSTHKVGVFQGWQGNWNYVQYWDCSDGAPRTPTVEGVFRVGIKGRYFDSGSSRCYWYTQFRGNYLFHSVLYSKYNGSLVDGRLGMPLSHGCVRLHINNAKWIYDTIPSGTTVVVYH